MTGVSPIDPRVDRPLRVLQVVQRFRPELGGLETHVAEVTSRLSRRSDIDVTILTTDRTGRLPRTETIDGVPVLRRRSWPKNRDYYFAPGIFSVIRKGDWDLVHIQGAQTLVPVVAMLAALAARKPYAVTFHSGGHSSAGHGLITRVQNALLRPLLRRATELVAVSRFERSKYRNLTGLPVERFTVISNGGALPPVPAGVTPRPGSIVTSGRLEKYKGHHRVIEAMPLIRRTIPDARLTILGSGPYEQSLRKMVIDRGLDDAVSFRHLQPGQRSEMAAELAGSAVMAALSDYEAHPVAIMEAIALGLPVVGSDVAGIGDLVEDGLVQGIEPDADVEQVAAALVAQLLVVPDVERRAPDVALPTWESCTDALAEVYHRAVPAAGRACATPLRIVHVIPTLTAGGAERQLESLIRNSDDQHHVIALYRGGPVADGITAAGATVEVFGLTERRTPMAVLRLARRIRRLHVDIVHVHLLSGQLWGLPAARLARVRRVVSTEHSLMDSSIENRPLTEPLRRLYLALSRLATVTVAVSAQTRQRLIRWGVPARRITVIENGIDFDRVAFSAVARERVRTELSISTDVVVLGAVGRLEDVKRFPELIAALAPTLRRHSRELVIVGAGPLQAELTALAERLLVADCIHLTGARSDVPALLSAMDVLVSLSRDETFGMAVVEALGAGLPVVYAQCPALEELAAPLPQAIALVGDEPTEIRATVERALAARSSLADRSVVEGALTSAYGIARTTARLDRLYADLQGTSGPFWPKHRRRR